MPLRRTSTRRGKFDRLLSRLLHGLGALIFVLALAPLPIWAVVGGSGIDPDSPDSPWFGVGVVENGAGQFTGAVIGPRLVLTAAHVTSGSPVANIRFRLNLAKGHALAIQARSVHIHPGFQGTKKGPDGFWHKDLALIELKQPVPAGVPIYRLSTGQNLLKSMVAFVGYGRGGDGVHGAVQPGDPRVRRVGYNRIDVLLAGQDHLNDLFLFDFDGTDYSSNRFKPDVPLNGSLGTDLEATFAGGDSGAPVFIFEAGQWRIVGVAALVAGQEGEQGRFGSIAGVTLIPAFLDWIREVSGGGVVP